MQLTNKALVLATAFVVSGLPASADDTVLISANTAGNAGNGPSIAAAVSGDGRYVVFSSEATDLVGLVGTDSPGVRDVFLRDRDPDGNGTFDEGNAVTELISVDSNEAQAKSRTSTGRKAITPDGRYVVFNVSGNDPQLGSGGIFVRDRMPGITVPMAVPLGDTCGRRRLLRRYL